MTIGAYSSGLYFPCETADDVAHVGVASGNTHQLQQPCEKQTYMYTYTH